MTDESTQRRIKVVVVDDQLLVREGLRRVLDATDDFAMVGECADGDEVLTVVESSQPDIVLMDMRMKRVDGVAAIRAMSGLADRPPVLVLTTFDDELTLADALLAGAEGFMLKESVGVDLERAMRTVAEGGAWIDPAVAPMVLAAFRSMDVGVRTPSDNIERLTEREVEVLRAMAHGLTNGEIAAELFISERTVKTHIGHVFDKLEVRDRVGAVLRVYESGLVDRPPR